MPRYSVPIDLERLERALRNAGFRSTQLTTHAGVESIELTVDGYNWHIDQAGNVDRVIPDGDTEGTVDPPAELTDTIRGFRES